MAGTPIYFGRKYRLSITPPGGGKAMEFVVEDGKPAMDIKFDVTYAVGQTAREGSVSILGLGFKTMHEILKLSAETRGKAMSKLCHLKLEAGYFTSAGMVEILNGFVWYATVSSPPQMWLTMKVSEYNPLGGRAVSLDSKEGMTLKALCEYVAGQFSKAEGKSIKVVDKTHDKLLDKEKNKKINFGKDTTLKDAVAKLNSDASEKVCFVLRTTKEDKGIRAIEAHDKGGAQAYNKTVEVDKDNGLLSVTGIDAVNGCITTFLDGRKQDELCYLKLTSRLNQMANGKYIIIKKQYVGHFMGQEWYVRYFCSAREKKEQAKK